MIEQLYQNTPPTDVKRKSLTDELQQLANEQEKLEHQRNKLKDSITGATSLLAPLREQMKDVVECMKRFYEMESSYAALSKQTYEDIHNDMQAIGSELLQTQSLLDDGTKLVKSGIELPDMTLPTDLLPKEDFKSADADLKEREKEERELSTDTSDVPVTPAAAIDTSMPDTDSIWTNPTEELDPELSAMLNGLDNRNYDNPEYEGAADTSAEFYDRLKQKLKDRNDVTIVADAVQKSALVEIFMTVDEASLHPEFTSLATKGKEYFEKLRIRGNYSNGHILLDYDAIGEDGVSPVYDSVTDTTKDSIKALVLPEIEKDLQENRQQVSESLERDL